jgi:hypothetical protein
LTTLHVHAIIINEKGDVLMKKVVTLIGSFGVAVGAFYLLLTLIEVSVAALSNDDFANCELYVGKCDPMAITLGAIMAVVIVALLAIACIGAVYSFRK